MLKTPAKQSKPGFYSLGQSGERLINYSIRPADGVSQAILVGRSGLVETVDLAGDVTKEVLAIGFDGSIVYAVCDGKLWSLLGTVKTEIGTLNEATSAQIATSQSQVAVVMGGAYFLYDGSTLAEYDTGAITVPIGVVYQDGYFVVAGESSGRSDAITVSTLDNGKSFNGLDFAFAEASSDGIVSIFADHGELWLFGASTIEIFYNSGSANFPFQRNSGALIETGCFNGVSVAKADNAVFWLGADGAVYRATGATPEVISTREIEEGILKTPVTGGFVYKDRGHLFYCLKTSKITLCYDLTTGLWSERSSGVDHGPWIASCRALAGNKEYLGTTTGKIVQVSPDVYTDDGTTVRAELVTPPIVQENINFRISFLEAVFRTGETTEVASFMLQTTKDGRHWSREKHRESSNSGDYYHAARWNGLGVFKRFQVRISVTDDVPRDLWGVTFG